MHDMNDALFALGEVYLAKRGLEQQVAALEGQCSTLNAAITDQVSTIQGLEGQLAQANDELAKLKTRKPRKKTTARRRA